MKHPLRLLAVLLLAATPLAAEEALVLQGSLGAAANLETPLTIRQSGFADLDLDADYETEPFTDPVYYSVRAGWWRGRGGWELEVIHHKLILRDPPPELRGFQISHGYNFVTVNRGWDLGRLLLRVGAGPILAHPEGAVRGQQVNPGNEYKWTGPGVQVGVEKRFAFGRGLLLGVEGKASAARANVKMEGVEVEAPSYAAHLLVSLGYRWRR